MKRLALVLIVVSMWAEFGWHLFDDDLHVQGNAWNLGQSIQRLLLCGALAVISRSWVVCVACILSGSYALLVATCAGWWLVAPMPIPSGQGLCAARFDVPIFLLQMAFGLWVLVKILRGK